MYRYDEYKLYLLLHTMCPQPDCLMVLRGWLLCAHSVDDWQMDEGFACMQSLLSKHAAICDATALFVLINFYYYTLFT
jgi:hypothetical protein